jgi:glutamine synthetase
MTAARAVSNDAPSLMTTATSEEPREISSAVRPAYPAAVAGIGASPAPRPASPTPYLALSALLLAGIRNKIEPPAPIDKDIYELPPEEMAEIDQARRRSPPYSRR